MKKWLLIILTTILIFFTLLFAFIFYNRMILVYNSEGNYFDENSLVVYKEQAKIIYGIITFSLLFLTLFTVRILNKISTKI